MRGKRFNCQVSVCLSGRLLSRGATAAAATGGFAAEVGRGQQISINSCCRATCGPRKFWPDCSNIHVHVLYLLQLRKKHGRPHIGAKGVS